MNIFGGVQRELPFDEKHYITGIARQKINKSFIYYYIKTSVPVNSKDLERINKLNIPPAWENVWVSSDPKSSIQATGIDSKNRKQYKYHTLHIEKAEQEKFLRMYHFVKDIPKLEKAMKRHAQLNPYDYKKVITTMLTIVRELHMRVGKEVYARENKSYGVTSLRKIHMKIDKGVIKFKFKGKSNKHLSYTLYDPVLAQHLQILLRLEGSRLFQYIENENENENENSDNISKSKIKHITDTDLNGYIQKYMGPDYTVKDFRTYAANYFFTKALLRETSKRSPKNEKIIKKNIQNALNSASYYLKHSKSISKKSYVMSFITDIYSENPSYFTSKLNEDPDDVLLDVLKMYRRKVLNI